MNKIKLGLLILLSLTTTNLAKFDFMPRIQQQASQKDITCLAQNVYHEARSETLHGQIAVAQVTVNRVKQSKFKKTVCEIVFAPNQFSWTRDRRLRVKDNKAWEASLVVARAVLTNSVRLPDFTATHYHTKKVNPSWNRNKQILAVIGSHIFYA
jgi:spore germination cell wall hydrolase CwlJ-like protein